MNTSQINSILRNDRATQRGYLGAFSWDIIPDMDDGASCVCNTDCSARGGSHWGSYNIINGDLEFFDSYGQHPSAYQTLPSKGINRYNTKVLQSFDSGVCGQWVCYYLLHRYRGYSMEDIVSRFGDDLHENDHYVASFINNLYGFNLDVHI